MLKVDEPRRKRQRQMLVCEFCRRRKVKCDKGSPCGTCRKYGKVCHYVEYAEMAGAGAAAAAAADYDDGAGGAASGAASAAATAHIDLETELEQLKSKIRSIEQQVTSREPRNGAAAAAAAGAAATAAGAAAAGHNPVASPFDTINFYSGYTSVHDQEPLRRANFGPFSWLTLLRKDPALSLLWNAIHSRRRHVDEKMATFAPGPHSSTLERHFSARLKESFGINDVRLYSKGKADPASPPPTAAAAAPAAAAARPAPVVPSLVGDAKSSINERARALGLSFYAGEIGSQLALADKIQLILPNQSVIWLLIDRFFTHVYPFFPVIDEVAFKAAATVIIGAEGYDNSRQCRVTVEKKLDFAHLGLLLLMLRFSYLSLLTAVDSVNERNLNTTDPSPAAQRLRFLLNNPINLEVVELSQACLNQFNLLRHGSMAIMQLALFTRLYHIYAPEDGDGIDGGDSQVFTATLVQMALSLGLNREPDHFADVCNDERVNNIGRKIWYMLVTLDLNNALAVGTPLNIRSTMFDTKLPFYKEGNANVVDRHLEIKVLESTFPRMDRVFDHGVEILDMVLDVKGAASMAELAQKLSHLECYFQTEFGKLRPYFAEPSASPQDDEPGFVKTIRMKVYFNVNFFLVTVFFHFFCHYERKHNHEYAFFYLKKILRMCVGDLMPYFAALLQNNPRVFRDSTDLIVTPGFEIILHKSLIVCHAVLIRIRIPLFTLLRRNEMDAEDHFSRLTKMDQLLQRCSKVLIEVFARLSKRYYYAWRVLKANNFVFDMVKGKEFYENIVDARAAHDAAPPAEMTFTPAMLDELIVLFEDALARVPRGKPPASAPAPEPAAPPCVPPRPSAAPADFPSAPPARPLASSSIASSSSTSSDFYDAGNESIDKLWLQMMALKRETQGNSANFTWSTQPEMEPSVETPAPFTPGVYSGDLPPIDFELFQGLSFEELFQS
ncbi:Zn(2)-C6 fungal-type domain-containing protein [[Candida] zeylanoides]